jgi:protein tyrosine phosphatase
MITRFVALSTQSSDALDLSYPATFEFGTIEYPTALHCFLAQAYPEHKQAFTKGKVEDAYARAIQLESPRAPYWQSKREEIMRHILRAKFGQHPSLLRELLNTQDSYLAAEPAPGAEDDFWTMGAEGQGENRLGILLMQIRGEYGGYGPVDTLLPPPLPHLALAPLYREIEALNASADEALYLRETQRCRAPELRALNRIHTCNYIYDATLVHLHNEKYINANYVLNRTYIAAQCPMAHTEEAFWQMALEHRSPVVVMLNQESDCEGYCYCSALSCDWKQIGSLAIRLLEPPQVVTHPSWRKSPHEDEAHGYRIRKVEVRNEENVHALWHYQYLNWRDRQCAHAACASGLIRAVHAAHQETPAAPIIVHCLAGVGRTSAYIVMHEAWKAKQAGLTPDVKGTLVRLRDPADGRYYKMMENPEQYISCVKFLNSV